ncbi:MAG: hypothetical protein EBQ80_04675 [Proteobacteria bacterium]|nr:hypothetical protein [Pseudomonadota bacterium]
MTGAESMRHRMAFINPYTLYKRVCDGTGKPIVSIYSPDKPYKVFSRTHWESDAWDAMQFGRAYDFSKTFAEQWDELNVAVPHIALWNGDTNNADYSHDVSKITDSYMVFDAMDVGESLYINAANDLVSCVDVTAIAQGEMLYECVMVDNGYKSFWCSFCKTIAECDFCYNCRNVKNCFGCVNVVNGQYLWFNQQLSKEEYERRRQAFWAQPNFMELAQAEVRKLMLSLPHKYADIMQCEDCTGHHLFNSSHATDCFESGELEHCLHCHDCRKADHAAYAGNLIVGPSYMYECQNIVGGATASAFCFLCADGLANAYYSTECYGCEYIFGCVGLKRKKYCIFNRQYTQEEYEALLPKIIAHMTETGEWGRFLPAYVSAFGYNESAAVDYFPLGEAQANELGCNWSDFTQPIPRVEKLITRDLHGQMPRARGMGDELVNWAIECAETGRPFQIMPMELAFYRAHDLPIPVVHPRQRLRQRLMQKNRRQLFDRTCTACGTHLKTTFAETRPERIVCEACYLQAQAA